MEMTYFDQSVTCQCYRAHHNSDLLVQHPTVSRIDLFWLCYLYSNNINVSKDRAAMIVFNPIRHPIRTRNNFVASTDPLTFKFLKCFIVTFPIYQFCNILSQSIEKKNLGGTPLSAP